MALSWLSKFTQGAQASFAKYNNYDFKQAMMAACALISSADGQVEPEEKKKVAAVIQKTEALQVFDPAELASLFNINCDKAADDILRIQLFSDIRKLRNDPQQAGMVLQVAIVIANADGEFEPAEKVVVGELCTALGLPASGYLS